MIIILFDGLGYWLTLTEKSSVIWRISGCFLMYRATCGSVITVKRSPLACKSLKVDHLLESFLASLLAA